MIVRGRFFGRKGKVDMFSCLSVLMSRHWTTRATLFMFSITSWTSSQTHGYSSPLFSRWREEYMTSDVPTMKKKVVDILVSTLKPTRKVSCYRSVSLMKDRCPFSTFWARETFYSLKNRMDKGAMRKKKPDLNNFVASNTLTSMILDVILGLTRSEIWRIFNYIIVYCWVMLR